MLQQLWCILGFVVGKGWTVTNAVGRGLKNKLIPCNKLRLTNGSLTKLFISYFVGNVGPHQHTHCNAELLLDHIRNEFKSIRPLVNSLQRSNHIEMLLCIHIVAL